MNIHQDSSLSSVPIDMLQAAEDCRNRCQAILEQFRIEVEHSLAPDYLYHYTDETGLRGIVVSQNLWLSDIFSMNDPSEIHHAVDYAKKGLSQVAIGGHRAAKVFAQQFDRIISDAPVNVASFFVASFSQNGDDLGQWRAYGNNGRGFSLQFDRELVERAFAMPYGKVIESNSTFPIAYSDARLEALYTTLAREIVPLIAMPQGRRLANTAINEFMKILSMEYGLCVLQLALYFKHEAYRHEAEYRFLQIRDVNASLADLRSRNRGSSKVRFTEFSWSRLGTRALRAVIIGPAADESAARSAIKGILNAGGIPEEDVEICRSKVPYRAT